MKRFVFIFGVLLFAVQMVYGQIPQKFSYQAVLRNTDGTVMANQSAKIKISLLSVSETGNAVYAEEHTVSTSAQGVISLVIGGGGSTITVLSGVFADIPWDKNIYLKVEVKKTNDLSYTHIGTSQILSVPYTFSAGLSALADSARKAGHATNASTAILADSARKAGHATNAGFANSAGYIKEIKSPNAATDAIFEVKNSNGDVVFGVYQNGVRIYVDGVAKGGKGGFAVGGLSGKGAVAPNLLYVDADSTRLYFNESVTSTTKGGKGGFAVGGLSGSKGTPRDRLLINSDSTRFYVNGDLSGQGGGFGITGLEGSPLANVNLFKVTKDSTTFKNNIYTQGNIVSTGSISTGGGVTSTPVTDIDGNTYQTVKIGTQTWMKENLRTSHYSYGKSIYPYDTAYNNTANLDTIKNYGKLYSYFAITDTSNVCPVGWHVPTPPDWDSLLVYVGGPFWKRDSIITGLRLMDKSYWSVPTNANNASGFSGRAAGQAMQSAQWFFSGMGTEANWWGKFGFVLKLESNGGVVVGSGNPSNAFSVRCVKGKGVPSK